MVKAVIFDMYETLITLYDCPLYFGAQMSADAGISEHKFQELWHPSESDRSIGKIRFEEIIEKILRVNDCFSEEVLSTIVKKRTLAREEAFVHINKEIIPMLEGLREKGILIGLISNCFSEEADVIKRSILYPYFDVACLSFDEGVQKPDYEIFYRCMRRLNVSAQECIYVGDGGSYELETARALGMHAVQAAWYLKENTKQPTTFMPEFEPKKRPLEILKMV